MAADAEEHEPSSSAETMAETLAETNSDVNDHGEEEDASEHAEITRTHTATIIQDRDRSELRRIATELSSVHGDHREGEASQEEEYDNDERLHPASPSFDLSVWLTWFVRKIRDDAGQPHVHPGLVFSHLTVGGSAPALLLQQTVGSWLRRAATAPVQALRFMSGRRKPSPRRTILHGIDGLLEGGELLVVLGRPGSGCSTLLKTMCGELHGLHVDAATKALHYGGVPQAKMVREFKGEVIYNQEVDKHFPELTVGQTLEFAAATRIPAASLHSSGSTSQGLPSIWHGRKLTREAAARYVAQVAMAVCGLSHTYDTKVGNEFVRGVSGGERKRVSIAEMMVAGSLIMAWDNSTRGLDSATALRFVEALRLAADISESAHAVAIYQASESIFALFDKATVLYDGHQIYFGPAADARAYFERMGWQCPARQTSGDFLTAVTNPLERRPRPDVDPARLPRTAVEFEAYWRASPEYAAVQRDMAAYQDRFPVDAHGPTATQLRETKTAKQARHVRPQSPYLVSLGAQVALNTKRAYQRTRNDLTPALTTAGTCFVLALIIGSIVYGTPDATVGFYAKSSALFMAVLLNALITITEINSLYAQRPIVEKHQSYAFYHPATEAIAGVVADVPVKFFVACVFNVVLYFLAGLRRQPGPFFVYFLFSYTATFTMAAIFRTMAALTKTISQAMSLAGVFILALVMYTGFVIAVPDMHPWFGWLRWINPLYYAFEALIANEFHGREFTCSVILPGYSPPVEDAWICASVGAVAGRATVNGDAYIAHSFQYEYAHVWRNFGIMLAFLFFFMALYFVATEINSVPSSMGEMLVYQEGHVPAYLKDKGADADADADADAEEKQGDPAVAAPPAPLTTETAVHGIQPQTDIFTWRDVVYDIQVQGEQRRLLSGVSGWVKPGTLTALMGVSGAGKTTLLDVLAERTTMGVITGDMLVNGQPRGGNFQRSTGYVQQQATVRESLRFSAMLRQPPSVSKADKYAFVEEVIAMLNMEDFADAVVGVPGEGLNVEQRKLLTIGVELAARPQLLLFLDEPTSGLDSQSSWAICAFLRKLADAGQAILCTIHQPSAMLFEQFDRLLFLAEGGRTVYFGDVGADSRTLLSYFAEHGARPCGSAENPAEYMLEIVGKTTAADGRDWHVTWLDSAERAAVDAEMEQMHEQQRQGKSGDPDDKNDRNDTNNTNNTNNMVSAYAMPFSVQLQQVTRRIFQQYWRMPHYIAAKLVLGIASGLFVGFTFFHARDSLAGTQDVIFSVFQILTVFTTLVQQIQPLFVTQRALYEVRERPGKTYSWVAFMAANIVVELPYQILTAIVTFACFCYPVVGAHQSSERQGLVLLYMIQLFVYASTFAHMCIAALPDAQTAGGIVTLLVMMSLIFSGVLQTPTALPGFWIFMYRVSPFTYWTAGVLTAQVHNRPIVCSETEMAVFDPPASMPGMTCGQYLEAYLAVAPGSLQNPNDTAGCRYCQVSVADEYLASSDIYWSDRWRNFGILWGYVVFNVAVAIGTYYVFRVRRWTPAALSLPRWRKAKA